MKYIQIDDFNGSLTIVYKDDGSGDPLVFESLKQAEDTLEENCQNGIIVPLSPTIPLLKKLSGFIEVIKFEEGEQIDKDDLKGQINELLI